MPALVGGVIVAGTVGGFFATRSSSREPSTAELQSTAATAAAVATAHLDADTQLLNATAASIGGNTGLPEAQLRSALRRNAPRDKVLAIVRTNADAASAVVVATSDTTPSIVGADIATSAARRVVLELARDRAGTGAAIVNRADGQSSLLDALPVYGTLDAPADIVGRRSALNGFVVSITPLPSIIGLPRGPESEISARIVDGDHVLGAFGRGADGSPNGSVVDVPLNANGLAWSVQAWSTPRASSLPWVVLFGGLVVAALATAAVTSRARSIAAAVAENEARNEELALVARTGPLLQQSLALGDLLPVFVVEIGDELGLDSASISLVSESGQLTRVFSLGSGLNAPEPDIVTVGPPAQSVQPGEMVTVPLQRVGRVVGAFQARAVRGLSHPQMETLQAVCALLAAAIGNVRLFQEEQDMVARLRDVDRMKTSFIGSVSHEL